MYTIKKLGDGKESGSGEKGTRCQERKRKKFFESDYQARSQEIKKSIYFIRFLDIGPQAVMDENGAFRQIVDRYQGRKAIFIADRGYESLNSFAQINHSGNKFLIRVKDIGSRTSVLRSFGPFPDTEFDRTVKRTLTRRQTKEIKAHPEIYKFVPKNQRFDYFGESEFYDMSFRVVRFEISDG